MVLVRTGRSACFLFKKICNLEDGDVDVNVEVRWGSGVVYWVRIQFCWSRYLCKTRLHENSTEMFVLVVHPHCLVEVLMSLEKANIVTWGEDKLERDHDKTRDSLGISYLCALFISTYWNKNSCDILIYC